MNETKYMCDLPLICGLTGCVMGDREPTLFELALVELNAKLEGCVQMLIQLGREVRQLEAKGT